MPKDKTHLQEKRQANRHSPLERDIKDAKYAKLRNKIKEDNWGGGGGGGKGKKEKEEEEVDEAEQGQRGHMSKSLSQKLLKQVQEQREEIEEEDEVKKPAAANNREAIEAKSFFDKIAAGNELSYETPYESEEEEKEYDVYEEEAKDIDPGDEAALETFMGSGKRTLDLAALIMQRIKEKEALSNVTPDEALKSTLEPKVVAVYTQIGGILKHYRSGRLPKAIKILPVLSNWEELLYLTQPESWSPAAVRQVTRIFASNLNEKAAQKYYYMVLLPQIRSDIKMHKKLNWHLYLALKKAVFKPAAFYKGVVIPLCESRDCSLREAIIVGSIIRKVTVPPLHSSVALLKIASMPYSGANSWFIRVLIDKKYALPIRVVDALVDHFLTFKSESRTLPVIWHQSLLSFAQRYKQDITAEQKNALKFLLREKFHHLITPEIRRELFSTRSRGDDTTAPTMDVIND